MTNIPNTSSVVPFSQGVVTTSQVQATQPEKTHPKKILIPDDEFQSDLADLTATALKDRYPQEYNSWRNMKSRCKKNGLEYDPALENWRDFLRILEQAPENGFTVDRIDNSKGYLIGNIRWASKATQGNNKSNNQTLTIDGITRTVAEWAKIEGTSVHTIRSRMKRFPPWTDYECLYGRTQSPTKPKFDQSQWSQLRPADIPDGEEWPPPSHLAMYETFIATSASTLSLWVGKERAEQNLPPSVWMAAAHGYRCRLLSEKVGCYLSYPHDPVGTEVPSELESDYERHSARVQQVQPEAVDWCMARYQIERHVAVELIQALGRLT